MFSSLGNVESVGAVLHNDFNGGTDDFGARTEGACSDSVAGRGVNVGDTVVGHRQRKAFVAVEGDGYVGSLRMFDGIVDALLNDAVELVACPGGK